ncbi:MAG TPA: hypothetical protein VGH19_16145 [Verrucomicrobiae bacterium]
MKNLIIIGLAIAAYLLWKRTGREPGQTTPAYRAKSDVNVDTGLVVPPVATGDRLPGSVAFGLSPEQMPRINDMDFARGCWDSYGLINQPMAVNPNLN